uniref:Putative ribonuclease H-like domain-containing protein n=1 Tax=Tanacetum cinerariifolium TaxID=118510 RepID=A0A6L2KLS6_TANCI|nr:putative ribonuclease H-like domain-containing protein [Tanacetum cinerariifolium]
MEAGATTTMTAKLPILNLGEYDLWLMKIEQYFLMTDYSLWEVIKNGNKVLTKPVRSNQLKFHSYQDAKLLMEAIKKRYGGNKESKKQENMNLKLLRSLPSEWKTHALIWRNKAELETISLDDLYNNLKIYEPEISGSSNTNQNPQNMAFVSSKSTSSTNEADTTASVVSTAHTLGTPINSTFVDNLSDAMICTFLESQPKTPQLAKEDPEQIDPDDLEEMDLHWEMAMLTIRARRFKKRTSRSLDMNGQRIGFDKTKMECFNCHKNGHFARECKALRNQDNKGREYGRTTVPVETPIKNALIAQDRIGGYDWSYQDEKETLTNYAFMTLRSSRSSSSSHSEVDSCSKTCIKAYADLKNKYDSLTSDYKKSQHNLFSYKAGLQSVEERLVADKTVKTIDITHKGVLSIEDPKSVMKNNFGPLIIENWHLDDDNKELSPTVDVKTVKPSVERIESVKTPREVVKTVESHKPHKHYPRGNKRNWNNLMATHSKRSIKKGVIDSCCSRHMTGNKCYLTDFEAFNGGFVFVGDENGRISGKGIENKLDHKVKVIRSDNETEFKNNVMTLFCDDKVVTGNQSNGIERTKENLAACQDEKKKELEQEYILLPIYTTGPLISQDAKDSAEDAGKKAPEVDAGETLDNGGQNKQVSRSEDGSLFQQNRQTEHNNSTNDINTVSSPVIPAGPSFVNVALQIPLNVAGPSASTNAFEEHSFEQFCPFKNAFSLSHVPMVTPIDETRIFGNPYDDDVLEEEVDMNNTLVDLPKDKWAIGTKWVYRNQKDERGIVIKNKARLVAQGHTQEEGIDYDEVFALVARIEAARLFFLHASFKDFVVYQMDVKSTNLYGKIEEEVYVCQPPDFKDPTFLDKVYKAEKALYRLHQASRAWYETLSTYLLDHGFYMGQIDKTLFIKRHNDDIMLVQVYVDDIIFGSTKKELIKQKSDGIFISQDKYVAEILKKFDFVTVKTASTLMESNKPLIKDEEAEDVDVHLYRLMIDSPFDLEAYSDSDYAGASLDRKSTTGGCQFLGKRLVIAKDGRCFVDTSEVTTSNTSLSTARLTTAGQRLLVVKMKNRQSDMMRKRNERITESAEFEQIIDFLKSKPIHYALTVNPTIYVSCVKQFWATVTLKRVNNQEQIQALVDKKKIIITEDNIRSDLRFDDAEGTACLPNEAIFEGLTRMGSTMASAILCLANNQKFNFSKYIFDNMVKSLERGIKFYLFPRFLQVFLDNQVEGRKNDDEMFGVVDLFGDEVVTTVADKVSAALTTDVTKDEITMAQALAALKSVKPTIPAAATTITTTILNPRAKGIVFHEQKQSHITTIRMDEEYARQLEAEEQEAARIIRAQQVEEANILWDNTQAMMKADSLLAKRLQARERKEFSEDQNARLLVELIEKTKKHFAALRAQEKRNKPPTKAQMRSQIEMGKINSFIAMDSKAQKSSRKKAQESSTKGTTESLEFDISKKQKIDENVIDVTEELNKCMEIVPDDGDEVLIEATSISSRSPTIIDYKIHKEGKKKYFKIIRADVKGRFKREKLVDDMDNLLFRTLKTMFEHNVEDVIWTYQQGLAKVYPLTRNTLHQLWNDVRLQVDHDVEMAYDTLRFIRK